MLNLKFLLKRKCLFNVKHVKEKEKLDMENSVVNAVELARLQNETFNKVYINIKQEIKEAKQKTLKLQYLLIELLEIIVT